jgi:hypothetical protein
MCHTNLTTLTYPATITVLTERTDEPLATTNRDRQVQDLPAFTALSTRCTHLLISLSKAGALQCRPVRETPIYEQLRGESTTADATPSQTAPPQSDRPGQHRRPADPTDPITLCTPPRPSTDPAAPQHPAPDGADQPPDATQQTAAERRLRATLPHPAHARQPRTQATSKSPTATGAYNC